MSLPSPHWLPVVRDGHMGRTRRGLKSARITDPRDMRKKHTWCMTVLRRQCRHCGGITSNASGRANVRITWSSMSPPSLLRSSLASPLPPVPPSSDFRWVVRGGGSNLERSLQIFTRRSWSACNSLNSALPASISFGQHTRLVNKDRDRARARSSGLQHSVQLAHLLVVPPAQGGTPKRPQANATSQSDSVGGEVVATT